MNGVPRTLYRKLVDSHTVVDIDDEHRLLYVDLHLLNEYTSPQAFANLQARGLPVLRPQQQRAVVSHVIPTRVESPRVIREPASRRQADNLADNCRRSGIECHGPDDADQGIEHVVAPELGWIRPGMVVVCGDSHTTTHGAFGALGFGVGTSDVAHVLATQTLVYQPAPQMRITVSGRLPVGTSAKDLVMRILRDIGAQGARGFAVEYAGPAIDRLSMEARMTLCNMTVEAGARAALIAPDAVTLAYLRDHVEWAQASDASVVPGGAGDAAADGGRPVWEAACADWAQLRSDAQAAFDVELGVDADDVAPCVSWGTSPDQTVAIDAPIPSPVDAGSGAAQQGARRALDYMGLQAGQALQGLPIDRVFIGSCTNGRIEDLREVAALVRGRRVAAGVRAMVVPGSGRVRRQAEAEGLAAVLLEAGFEWRQPGCSMCLAMNDDVLGAGQRCASTTNRNFEGRQGAGGRTHLMSPAMAAAAALTGTITDVRTLMAPDGGRP